MLQFFEAHIDVIVQIVTFIIMGLVGYINLKAGQKYQLERITDILGKISETKNTSMVESVKMDGRMSAYEQRFIEHLDSQTPHKLCLAETLGNAAITARLDRIQSDIGKLHNWTMTIVTGIKGGAPLTFKDDR